MWAEFKRPFIWFDTTVSRGVRRWLLWMIQETGMNKYLIRYGLSSFMCVAFAIAMTTQMTVSWGSLLWVGAFTFLVGWGQSLLIDKDQLLEEQWETTPGKDPFMRWMILGWFWVMVVLQNWWFLPFWALDYVDSHVRAIKVEP